MLFTGDKMQEMLTSEKKLLHMFPMQGDVKQWAMIGEGDNSDKMIPERR